MKGHRYVLFKILTFGLLTGILLYQVYRNGASERRVQRLADAYRLHWEQKNKDAEPSDAERRSFDMLAETGDSSEKEERKEMEKSDSDASGQDTYDGVVDCLLEIPSIDLCRVVITGGNREKNLERHYFVAARQEMRYGEGSYVIFGHQSFIRGKGFNRLDELKPGDCIYIITEKEKTAYQVTEVVDAQWDEAWEDFTDDKSRLAIYTCRKQREQVKPYMVVRAVKNP